MLEIAQLTYAYHGKSVLEVESFRLSRGRHALLLGPSGSGKSTLLNLLAGILRPQSGSLIVAGTQLATLSARETDAWRGRTVGLILQQLALVPSMTARDNILLSPYAINVRPDHQRVDTLLDALGLAGHGEAKPHQLSQGQRQRVALARAVYGRPRLILADEPTANLDDKACMASIALLSEVARSERASLVIASHDARVLAALPEAQVLRLDDGKVVL